MSIALPFPVPSGLAGLKQTFGDFAYTELSKGYVEVDRTWQLRNLTSTRNICATGSNIYMSRILLPHFQACLTVALAAVPDYKVRMLGGFCARHKNNDPKRSLSVHSWGAAFDVNWDKNPYGGTKYDLPQKFVKAFTEAGWDWGGNWKGTKDWMHFQFCLGY